MSKDQPVIFIVDDDPVYTIRLKAHLTEKSDFKAHIYTFGSGEECLAHIDLEPDIVVLNYYFAPIDEEKPGKKLMNGLEFIDHLKALNPNIHLILLTNETDVEVANTTIKEGANDYIVKYEYAPVQLKSLISKILLNKVYTQKLNYWKWGAIAIGVLLIMMIIYLLQD
jgi:DNA-binding NarL/FixJ family response regulator